jgi:hypothetical protein
MRRRTDEIFTEARLAMSDAFLAATFKRSAIELFSETESYDSKELHGLLDAVLDEVS